MTQPVAISTKDFAKSYAADLYVGVGDTPMWAKCPKDTVWNQLAQVQEEHGGDFGEPELRNLIQAVFGVEGAPKALAMLDDPANHDVSLESMGGLIGWCMEQWGPEVQKHFESLKAGQGNRAQRRIAVKKTTAPKAGGGKAPAKGARKTAAKKTAAKKTAATRRG
ncbi:hypothetical protein [Streptomyces sp. NPDC049879]|uniref:hypothetical protein n=1 Tax=Streptomyces sp. NPDC049879 TaxID=3365598 RepID=UPI003795BCF8